MSWCVLPLQRCVLWSIIEEYRKYEKGCNEGRRELISNLSENESELPKIIYVVMSLYNFGIK
jgi:hypothetical protein